MYEKVFASPRPSPKSSFTYNWDERNWVQKLPVVSQDENVDADHVRTGRRVCEQPSGLFTQCEA